MGSNRPYPAWMLSLGLAGIMSCLYALIDVDHGAPIYGVFLILMIYAVLGERVLGLFLRRERSLYALTALDSGLMVVALVLGGVLFGFGSVKSGIGVLISYVIITVANGYFSVVLPRQNHLLLLLDGSVVVLLLLMGALSIKGATLLWCIPGMISGGIALLGLFVGASGGRPETRQWMLFLMLLALIGGTACFVAAFGAEKIGAGLVVAWKGFLTFLRWIGNGFERFVTWLAGFFHKGTYEAVSAEAQEVMGGAQGNGDGLQPAFGVILGAILAIGIALAGIAALIIYGNTKLKINRPVVGGRRRINPREPFFSALKQRLMAVRAERRFYRLVRANRNTAWGIYYLLIRWCRRTPLSRKNGESPSAFLTRIQDWNGSEQDWYDAFAALIPLVDRSLFGKQRSDEAFQQADFFHQHVRKTLRISKRAQESREPE